jgi:hypothetical protein
VAARFAAVAAALVVVACVSQATLPVDPEGRTFCARGVGLDAVLHGSPSDARVAWAVDNVSGQRIELVWPQGYQARFDPDLTIFRAGGSIVAREGDLVTGGCNDVDQPEAPIWVSRAEISRP